MSMGLITRREKLFTFRLNFFKNYENSKNSYTFWLKFYIFPYTLFLLLVIYFFSILEYDKRHETSSVRVFQL